MLTYVIASSAREFDDYCREHQHNPAAARLVRSAADLALADTTHDRVVFFGRCYELPEIDALLHLTIGRGAPAELSSGFPRHTPRSQRGNPSPPATS